MADSILTAATIITMDDAVPRAQAVAVSGDTIVAVGSVEHCRAKLPGAELVDTGVPVLAPGFVEPHGHPLISGVATQAPARSVAPWDAPSWAEVQKIFADALATSSPDTPLWFAGYDALLHGHPAPAAHELDQIFGDRITVITDNSGHGVYFNSALIRKYGWDVDPPADPVAAHYGRNADGSLNGQGFELPVVTAVTGPLMAQMGDPLLSAANYFALMSRGGYTSTSDMTYDPKFAAGYEALAAAPSCPLRVSMWEMSITETYTEPTSFTAGESWLSKAGVKLWTDGSPWVGNIAISFPYLDTEATRTAGIDPATAGGARSMNYSREQLDAILDRAAPAGWQMAFHANGDLALDLALDAYEDALTRHGLLGTDHRWRLEHCGAGTREHFDRAARLGVHVSLAPFQYYYWGELLDGQMFAPEHGARWAAFNDAVASGACVSLHNDGSVSPPTPVVNIATAATRRTRKGGVHRADQAISLDQAWRAQTIDAARTLRRDHLVGSIAVGKLADFVELSADPWTVDPATLVDTVRVTGTWLGGRRIDLDEFVGAIGGTDNAEHAHLAERKAKGCC
ncbi:putative TIM-barrel fold metal-dependent hydrolase [Mycolicibacterium chubuense NBB4]|uniref:Putative TIM-barrel fold metal-dependent hydrolase n=1 Tax=Mycolicibacterium chubuense (strain NBB4) TaxID=710421 RepID=I4BL48_MYCCN|nr:amidohydrolase family protein [Mycolicibacterium chubuense]AFM18005.1 putative TIM-barrel fold metal-dependent hydrolase [Mycolicibacterium chubuense NBB4]